MPHCYQSIVINAPPIERVWDTLKNFHDMSWAASAIAKVQRGWR